MTILILLILFILILTGEYGVAMLKRGDNDTKIYIGASIDGFSQTQYYALRELFYSTGGNCASTSIKFYQSHIYTVFYS